jgi:two-component system nitrogen regulation sensor histidine kinase NtrY
MFFIGLWTVVLSLISALLTFLILTGLTPIIPTSGVVLGALFLNVILIVAVIAVIATQVSGLITAWREKVPGARFHIRIVALFSIIAALPALLVAIGATVSFSRSLDNWFSDRVRAIIDNSTVVARTYLEEHGQVIRTDIVNMARDLNAAADLVQEDKQALKQLITTQAGLRDLPAAYVIDRKGQPVLRAIEAKRLPFVRHPPHSMKPPPARSRCPSRSETSASRLSRCCDATRADFSTSAARSAPPSSDTCARPSKTLPSTERFGVLAAV